MREELNKGVVGGEKFDFGISFRTSRGNGINCGYFKVELTEEEGEKILRQVLSEKDLQLLEQDIKKAQKKLGSELSQRQDLRKRKVEENGYIYLLRSSGMYKLGRVRKLKQRIVAYKTENPNGYKIVFQKRVKDYCTAEEILKKKFQAKVVKGKEWFNFNAFDIKYIKNYLLARAVLRFSK